MGCRHAATGEHDVEARSVKLQEAVLAVVVSIDHAPLNRQHDVYRDDAAHPAQSRVYAVCLNVDSSSLNFTLTGTCSCSNGMNQKVCLTICAIHVADTFRECETPFDVNTPTLLRWRQ